ncbi:MAG: DUF4192 domain-containing protein [Propionibacteriales bacterium]|nr:DUF4192 domain-containing protein [Propionibacteriales bacterium]
MTTFTARTPADLLALVPIVIGFHPEDSVVLLTFGSSPRHTERAGAGVRTFQARVDLPVVEQEQRYVASMLRDVVRKHGITVVAVVLYTDDAAVAARFADLLMPRLLADGIAVVDVLRVDGDRYFCVAEPDDPGTAFDLRSHPLTAQGVLHGRVVHESREAMREALVGSDVADIEGVARAAEAFVDKLSRDCGSPESAPETVAELARWLQRTIARTRSDPTQLSSEDAAGLLVLLCLDTLREVAWSELRRENAASYVVFLSALVRRAPADLVPGAAGLLGLAAWLEGDGALAWCALDRCLAENPDDNLAQHVAALLESATPPSVWAPLPTSGLPVLRTARDAQPGSGPESDLGSLHGSGRRRAGVQPD